MNRQSDGTAQPDARLRRWAVRTGLICLCLEAAYLIVGNVCLRKGVLEEIINSKPEEDFISWESARTIFPGFLSFKEFTYRGQSLDSQMYIHLEEVDTRISLTQLLFSRTLHLRGMHARDLDVRYRQRIDFPCWTEESGESFPEVPANIDHYPEIPGFENPPDLKPEDLYPQEKEDKPWTVRISGARIEGPVQVAFNEIRMIGDGTIKGGLTVVLRESYSIDRGKIQLVPATLAVGSRELTGDLDLRADVRVDSFPAICAETSEIVGGLTGSLKFAGQDANGFMMHVDALTPLIPGQGVLSIESGTGELAGWLEVDEDKVVSGRLDLVSDDLVLRKRDDRLYGDLQVHTTLSAGDLVTGRFDVSGTTIRLDDIVRMEASAEKQEKLEPWFCDLELEQGILTLGQPVAADSHVRVRMYDTRPVAALLRTFTNRLKWLSLMRNVKEIDGTMDLDFGQRFVTVDDLVLTGENLEILGWIEIRDQKKTGRIFVKDRRNAAGFAFQEGRGRVILIKPREWFDKQPGPSSSGGQPRVQESG